MYKWHENKYKQLQNNYRWVLSGILPRYGSHQGTNGSHRASMYVFIIRLFQTVFSIFLKYLLHHKTQIKRMKNEKITYEQNKYKYSITKTNIGEYPLVSFLGMALTKYQWLSKGIYVSLLCSYFVIFYYYLMYLFKY